LADKKVDDLDIEGKENSQHTSLSHRKFPRGEKYMFNCSVYGAEVALHIFVESNGYYLSLCNPFLVQRINGQAYSLILRHHFNTCKEKKSYNIQPGTTKEILRPEKH
jgi:hypothetical protein